MQSVLTALRGGHWMRLAGPLTVACVLAAFLATNVGADTTPTTYYACVNMKTGSIYMVNAGDTCKSSYTPISWNQVGPQGPQGPAGPTGPQGPQGPAGPTQTLTITQESVEILIPPGSEGFTEAGCPTGTLLTGGGFWFIENTTNVVVMKSAPDPFPSRNAWYVDAFNSGPDAVNLDVFALCASMA